MNLIMVSSIIISVIVISFIVGFIMDHLAKEKDVPLVSTPGPEKKLIMDTADEVLSFDEKGALGEEIPIPAVLEDAIPVSVQEFAQPVFEPIVSTNNVSLPVEVLEEEKEYYEVPVIIRSFPIE